MIFIVGNVDVYAVKNDKFVLFWQLDIWGPFTTRLKLFCCHCRFSPSIVNEKSVHVKSMWINTTRVYINVFCIDRTSTRATSLLLLFMQQPWAVAGCMKTPAINKTCSQQSSSAIISLNRPLVSSFRGDVFNFALRFGPRVWADDHSAFVASVFLLHEQRTGWSSRLGTERRWRAGGLFTIITRSRWRHATGSGLGQSGGRVAISNTLYLESGYIIEVQQRPVEGGTSAGILSL